VLSKSEFRKKFLLLRESLPGQESAQLSRNIQQKLISYIKEEAFKVTSIGLYSPIKNEVGTSSLFEYFKEQGSKIYYPVVQKNSKSLRYFRVTSESELNPGAFGVAEPLQDVEEAHAIDLLVVPGLSFDLDGNRLGYGKGYYDSLHSFPVHLKVGLVYDFQITRSLPVNDHDLACDVVITEKKIISRERTI
jgi:5-formyltetrahydrofolate cyclo-ligase